MGNQQQIQPNYNNMGNQQQIQPNYNNMGNQQQIQPNYNNMGNQQQIQPNYNNMGFQPGFNNNGETGNFGYQGGEGLQPNIVYQQYPIQPNDFNNQPYNINQYPNPNLK